MSVGNLFGRFKEHKLWSRELIKEEKQPIQVSKLFIINPTD